jgi:hypothetical protein
VFAAAVSCHYLSWSIVLIKGAKLRKAAAGLSYRVFRNWHHPLKFTFVGTALARGFPPSPQLPPHVLYGLHGLPSRLWPKCNPLLRLGRPWGAVTLSRWGGWSYMIMKYQVKVKVEQPNYRRWQALMVPGVWGSQILRQSAHEGGKVVSSTHRQPLPPRNIPGTNFC